LVRLKTSEKVRRVHTLLPNSWAIASAMAVLPVPGGPAIRIALPAIFFDFTMSTTIPAAYKQLHLINIEQC
jgi:hypothetical protein